MKKIALTIAIILASWSARAQVIPARFDALSANSFKFSSLTERPLFPTNGIRLYNWANRIEWKDSTMVIKWLVNNTDLAGYSLSTHKHDDLYDALGIGHSEASDHLTAHTNAFNHANIHAPGSDNQDLSGYSLTGHNHNGAYSLLGHDHNSVYSLLSHNHTGTYLTTETDPLFTAWLLTDPVTDLAIKLGSAAYARLSDFAAANHNHSGVYDPAGTGHTEATDHMTAHTNAFNHANIHAPGSDNQDLSGYSLTTHKHDDLYDALGIGHSEASDHLTAHTNAFNHANIHAPGSDNQDLSGYSLTGHNHNGAYSLLGHDHNSVYSLLSHNHTGTYLTTETDPLFTAWLLTDPVTDLAIKLGSAAYARLSDFAAANHNHSGVYDPFGTGHNEATDHMTAHTNAFNHANIHAPGSDNQDLSGYSLTSHNHTGVYATHGHDHNTVYSLLSHDHATLYSVLSHDHASLYSVLAHNHNSAYMPFSGGTFTGDVTVNDNVKVNYGSSGAADSYTYWNNSMYFISSNYHSFMDMNSNNLFNTNANGVNVPAGKTYQIEGVPLRTSDWDNLISELNRNLGSAASANISDFVLSRPNVQVLVGTTPTLNVRNGINAKLDISGNTTITLTNLVAGMSGQITVYNPSTVYTITFSGYTNEISPPIFTSSNVVTCSGGSKRDCFSWYWDGTTLIWNGTKGYQQ